jgi:hypothetical protein
MFWRDCPLAPLTTLSITLTIFARPRTRSSTIAITNGFFGARDGSAAARRRSTARAKAARPRTGARGSRAHGVRVRARRATNVDGLDDSARHGHVVGREGDDGRGCARARHRGQALLDLRRVAVQCDVATGAKKQRQYLNHFARVQKMI